MNEAETRAELIDPALKAAGWGEIPESRIRREVIAPGRLVGSGKRSRPKSCDYVLVYRNQKLAALEAKKVSLHPTEGLGQAKDYAERLKTPFALCTNGEKIYQVDLRTGEEKYIDRYPTPAELWELTYPTQNHWRNRFAAIPFEDKQGTWEARYYQHNAIEAVLEAISQGKNRMLLTLATGTGKTFIAFQLAWKLFQAKWNISGEPTHRPRILFLADRNILANQAFNAFGAFDDDALVRIDPKEIKKKGKVPKNGSLFFSIFQTFMTTKGDKDFAHFYDYAPDFFDFIIIDECHRGGANDESTWRKILEYFSPAVQLGLTATPKRDVNGDTYKYFGEPLYTYSLKEGINDGYLTPFKVVQFTTTLDEYLYDPDDDVIEGDIDEARTYEEKDFNRIIEMEEREKQRVQLFMEAINQNEKTLVFCATQDHALAVRDLINQMKISTDPNYCVRVTANDGSIGETNLKTFQDNEKAIPTILTTSRKLSTGVDARNVRNIVLLRPINSMIEFKQIIGRGTRLFDNKDYFTIYDFVRAYEHFNDDEWDGEPTEPVAIDPEPRKEREKIDLDLEDEPEENRKPQKIKVKLADGKERELAHTQTTTFWDADGKPISAQEFIEKLFGDLPDLFKDEAELRTIWGKPDTRKSFLTGLAEKGYGDTQLKAIARIAEAEKSDVYDVLTWVAYNTKPISREERVIKHRDLIFSKYTGKQQEFLDFVLDQYIREGVEELDRGKLPTLIEIKYQTVNEGLVILGQDIGQVFADFQADLYTEDVA
ncbi:MULTISPECIES: EcoAI/FtnUII family type I restriction enzme subunit R [Cyanophyceae]|nr:MULTISPECIES: type I restriction endonuclease subunit R [Cyanophyceae]ACB00851.1 type I site-specific restriction-modification system, R (restriction) subunit [Picosynechococcus sp. PCC 7002]SMH59163.1 type I restriction enzyme, R subunit [Picosynechococcus sp. OG1]SMQ86568.1 type I restriction enzyme, R subunit [Synechococcus sp. 7002]